MPPRIPLVQCLRAQNACPASTSRAFSSTPSSQASTVTQRKRHRDPYAIAQAKARKAANLSRQEVLKKERASVLGDPVRGVTTPFVKSFDDALPLEPSPSFASTRTRIDESPVDDAPGPAAERDEHLNFYFSKSELDSGIMRSKWLTQPLESTPEVTKDQTTPAEEVSAVSEPSENPEGVDFYNSAMAGILQRKSASASRDQAAQDDARMVTGQETLEDRIKRRRQEHETAQEALKRISSLSLGSSKDRLRVNIQRCIDEFGRHNTDHTLPPRPAAAVTGEQPEAFPRVGSDTGSSEVQIAILTAKIRTLADSLELRGTPTDKVNKRNLRLLVHKRAKLLKYMRRKERGGPRWQNLIEKLGLTDGTWKGEISL
ncbi:related to ribosomal S15 [Lecanosticta acicola]|uniref:Related to ribosomal S15 n=1 Tax=Lecanosticta acicola TaxID=111012 RepID=A0AAI8YWH9_9PEZI|nr:related to ribosomal S15 [Lecanosticta acicola]